jgi:archaemetzincin
VQHFRGILPSILCLGLACSDGDKAVAEAPAPTAKKVVDAPSRQPPDATPVDRSPSKHKICLQPLGKYEKRLLAPIQKGIEYLFGFTVEVLPERPLPEMAYYKPRKRYRAEKLLDYLDRNVHAGSDCFAVMGFTKVDISTTKGKYVDWGVLGLGTLGGPSGVVSSYRMIARGEKWRMVQMRAVKVVNHELGHVLGLDHIDGKGCLMEDAKGTVKTVDGESGLLCQPSREAIERDLEIDLPVIDKFDWKKVL